MDDLVNGQGNEMASPHRVAIIPARGGSKRIPRKNIVDLAGRPLMAWTIEAALESQLFERVVVSTEDEEIARVAVQWGAEVPFLRSRDFDDVTPISAVTIGVLDDLETKLGLTFDTVAQLMANCPLRTSGDIRAAVDAFERYGRSLQISCFRFGWQNPWWALQLDGEGRGTTLFDTADRRSQDLPPLYCPTGAIWLGKVDALRTAGTFYGRERHYEPLSWISAVDIDDAEDLVFAKAARLIRASEA